MEDGRGTEHRYRGLAIAIAIALESRYHIALTTAFGPIRTRVHIVIVAAIVRLNVIV